MDGENWRRHHGSWSCRSKGEEAGLEHAVLWVQRGRRATCAEAHVRNREAGRAAELPSTAPASLLVPSPWEPGCVVPPWVLWLWRLTH